jgi:putative ABC transport system ATP-binding protein
VAIARPLVHDPPLLLADEPTTHLDRIQVEGILRLMRDLASPGRTVVVSTHDVLVSRLADRMLPLPSISQTPTGCPRTWPRSTSASAVKALS